MIQLRKTILLICALTLPVLVFAQESGFKTKVAGDWKASVFGDISQIDALTADNFEISASSNTKVLLRSSNNKGKIAGSSEGIAYYYQEIPATGNFELSATATVKEFNNNAQVSFGIMVRDTILVNTPSKDALGSYLAVGPVSVGKNPQFVFSRTDSGLDKIKGLSKSTLPAPGVSYKINLKKTDNTYVLTFGDEDPVTITNFSALSGNKLYIGFFTARNTTVDFDSIVVKK